MKKTDKEHTAPAISDTSLMQESMASLASGMADNFNNILTTVMGACSLIDKDDPSNSELLYCVALIRASAERAATLSERLTRSVAQEKDNGRFDNNPLDTGSTATSERDKKTFHDIVPTNNQPDGAKS